MLIQDNDTSPHRIIEGIPYRRVAFRTKRQPELIQKVIDLKGMGKQSVTVKDDQGYYHLYVQITA